MKTGLGLQRMLKTLIARVNLFRYRICLWLLGRDHTMLMLRRVDKVSMLLILRRNGAIIGINCDIETGLVFHNCRDFKNLIVGNNCHIGKDCLLDLRDRIEINDNAVISMRTMIITHTDMRDASAGKAYPPSHSPVIIEEGVYVGAGVTILSGVTIGRGSLVAAGAVVNADVEPMTVAGGVPANIIRHLQEDGKA